MRKLLIAAAVLLFAFHTEAAKKPKFDYSLVVVPEEGGIKFEKITEDADGVFSEFLVGKTSSLFGSVKKSTLDWWVNPQIAVSPDGKKIGYINYKNKTSNIMIKSASKGGSSVQRTFRTNVEDFTWTATSTMTTTFIFGRNVLPNEWQRNEAGRLRHKSEIATFHK